MSKWITVPNGNAIVNISMYPFIVIDTVGDEWAVYASHTQHGRIERVLLMQFHDLSEARAYMNTLRSGMTE